jgi:hypothetical protein
MVTTSVSDFADICLRKQLFRVIPAAPMPHHPVPSHIILRRLSRLAASRPCTPLSHASSADSRPLLPFLWTARPPYQRALSTTPRPRAHDFHNSNMGKEKKGGNFQLKTPKGTRDCMRHTSYWLVVWLLIGLLYREWHGCRPARTDIFDDYECVQVCRMASNIRAS